MEGELKKIKKLYGEEFVKLCRRLFPDILEEEGKLLSVLTECYAPTRLLYSEIVENDDIQNFKYYIYHKIGRKTNEPKYIKETPEELLASKGYKLIKCETNDDVQKFRKYYDESEKLCTFADPERVDVCHVFFVVHENAENLRRSDFTDPKREDEYGVSVMSFQFDKIDGVLSIKNRYNHTVENPDCTYENNLDNIVPGLTDSFAIHYGIHEEILYEDYSGFCPNGFIQDENGKAYKYNLEIDGVYFCENNIVVENVHFGDNLMTLSYGIKNMDK